MSTCRNGADATGLCDGIPRLFVGRLIAIAASPLMQHVRAYRGCDDSASPNESANEDACKTGGLAVGPRRVHDDRSLNSRPLPCFHAPFRLRRSIALEPC